MNRMPRRQQQQQPEVIHESVANLINYLTDNQDVLLTDKKKLKTLKDITLNVLKIQNDPTLKRIIKEHGWSKNQYIEASLDIKKYIKSLTNFYLSQINVNTSSLSVARGEYLTESEKVASFLPDILIKHLTHNTENVSCSRFRGAALLVDISGFSTYSATMCSKGVKGLDDLHHITNVFLGDLVSLVYQYGGDG